MSIVMFPTEEKAYPTEESGRPEDFKLDLDLETLNLTSESIDFDEIDEDLERFQEDEMVKQALHRGVDLRKYGLELEKQLKEVTTNLTHFDFLCTAQLFCRQRLILYYNT